VLILYIIYEKTLKFNFFVWKTETDENFSLQNGSAARFDEPGIFLFDTQAQAEAFAEKY